ncbi:hypothetical protein CRG98_040914 [Punica granatum]|uniref:Uncharacterized protein n=1 Tax=Punica granatum TaxID=22663 RepID=A0A2I0I5L2_PUNGR|nr:hypothetical protein CRG98_040914 [Punica granatum]
MLKLVISHSSNLIAWSLDSDIQFSWRLAMMAVAIRSIPGLATYPRLSSSLGLTFRGLFTSSVIRESSWKWELRLLDLKKLNREREIVVADEEDFLLTLELPPMAEN